VVAEVTAAPAAAAAAAPSPAPTAIPLTHAERVQAFIDNLHISGVRASGTDSKALVDGHVYKINDILDRALGIKLVKIDADSLTLVDSDGKIFVKTF
jgi:3-oxoacyl-ACP reductase-like protein